MPVIQRADTPLQVDENRPSEEEIKRAIRHLKDGKAAGPEGIPPEARFKHLDHEVFGKIWETGEISDDWKGYLIKLPKKGDLKECQN